MKRPTKLLPAILIAAPLTLLTACGEDSSDTTPTSTEKNGPIGNLADNLKDSAKEMGNDIKAATQKLYDQFKDSLAGYGTQLTDLKDRATSLDDDKLNQIVTNLEKKIQSAKATLKDYLASGSDSDKSALKTLVDDVKKLITRATKRADELEG